jgi:hypothetical protein
MKVRHVSALTVASLAFATTTAVGLQAASARVPCDTGEFNDVTSHSDTFEQADAVKLINKGATTATLKAIVGESHTSTREFSASVTVGVEASFWVFAKAKAEATAGVSLATSSTMSASYEADVPVPAHQTYQVLFGFDRYNQYVRAYHLVQSGASNCAVVVDHEGWVDAPYEKTFVIKKGA